MTRHNLKSSTTNQAILFMITTLFMFSVMDIIAKYLNNNYETFQIVWARYTSQTVLAFLFLAPRLKILFPSLFSSIYF